MEHNKLIDDVLSVLYDVGKKSPNELPYSLEKDFPDENSSTLTMVANGLARKGWVSNYGRTDSPVASITSDGILEVEKRNLEKTLKSKIVKFFNAEWIKLAIGAAIGSLFTILVTKLFE